MAETLRSLLRDAEPRLPLKPAWAAFLQANRARRRAGVEVRFGKRAEIERALDLAPPTAEAVVELKTALKQGDPAAVERALAWVPRVRSEPVEVWVTGWPDGFPPELQRRLLRTPPGLLAPTAAAALQREFDGFVLGGSVLRVQVGLGEGEVLPAVPRHLRGTPPRRGRTGPWLPHVDAAGRRFLTPEALAMRQAARVAELGPRVIDGFCGCGGNTVAFTRRGLEVTAVERDPARAALARLNAPGVDVRTGDLGELLPDLPPDAVLFLDPPWEAGTTWARLMPVDIDAWPRLALKLPRDFDLASLPARPWSLHWEFGEGDDDDSIVRMITALSVLP